MKKRPYHQKVLGALIFVSPLFTSAQTAASGESGYFSNPLFNTLLAVILLLAIIVIALGSVLKTISMSGMLEERFKKTKEAGSKTTGPGAALLLLFLSFASNAQSTSAVSKDLIGGLSPSAFYLMIVVIAIELLVAGILMYLIKEFLQTDEAVERKKLTVKPKEKTLYEKLNPTVAVEDEESILLDHNYDGIRELDNDLPPWWKYSFYLTILIAVIYMINYHITKTAPLQGEEYRLSMAKAEAEIAEFMKTSAGNVDESTVTMLAESADLAKGKDLFMNNCAVCHGKAGEGTVGPNLTDDFWLHDGSLKGIFKTIKYGWPENGMKSWKEDFSPVQIAQLSSFIKTLVGTNPPNAKDRQGEFFQEKIADPASEKKDTVKTVAEQ